MRFKSAWTMIGAAARPSRRWRSRRRLARRLGRRRTRSRPTASSRSAGRRTRRRSTPSSARTRRPSRSGRSTGTCSSTSAPRTSPRSRASPRAGTSPTTRRRSPSTSIPTRSGPTASRSPRRTSSTRSRCWAATARCSPSYTENVTKIETPNANTVVIHTKRARRPDRRRPLHLHPPQARLGQGAGQRPHRLVRPEAPAGRQRSVHRHRLPAQSHHDDGEEPELPGAGAEVRRDPVHPLRQPGRRRAGAPGRRGRHGARGVPRRLRANRRAARHRHAQGVIAGVHGDGVQQLPGEDLPGRRVQSRDPGPSRPPGHGLCGRPRAHQRDRLPGHRVPRSRNPAAVLQVVLRGSRPTTTRTTRRRRSRSSTTRAGVENGDGPRTKGDEELSFNLYVRSESPSTIQSAKLVAEEAKAVGIEYDVQVVSTDKLYDLYGAGGERQAGAGLRHVHLGLGRRSLRPELPAQHPHDRRDRRPVRLVLLEPHVRPALQAAGRSVRHRRAQGDHPADGRDHPARPAVHRADLRPESCRPTGPTGLRTSSRSVRRTRPAT